MAVKKYLYREDQSVFDMIDAFKKTLADNGVKCSTKEAMSHLIKRGWETEQANPNDYSKKPEPVAEPEFSPAPVEEPKE